jgi:hypothetical protein
VTYRYLVSNPGDVDLHSVSVRDDNGTPGIAGDDRTVCQGLSLAPGASTECTRQVQFSSTSTVTAKATGTSSGGYAVQASASAQTLVLPPRIGLVSTPDRQVVFPGDILRMTYRVSNNGTETLTQITVKDDGGDDGEFVACSGLTLQPGAQATCSRTFYLIPEAGFSDLAGISGQSFTIVTTATGFLNPPGKTVSTQTRTPIGVGMHIYLPNVSTNYY